MQCIDVSLSPQDQISSTLLSHVTPTLNFPQKRYKYQQFCGILSVPCYTSAQSLTISFSCETHPFIFLLDLSPYMMVYNYGTHSLPLDNLRCILYDVISRMVPCRHPLTIYTCSVCHSTPTLICESLSSYTPGYVMDVVNSVIRRSGVYCSTSAVSTCLSEVMQKVLMMQGYKALSTFVTISSFNEEESKQCLLLTPNWMVIVLLSTGGHYGTHIVSAQSIKERYHLGGCNRMVLESQFVQNSMKRRVIHYREDSLQIGDLLERMTRLRLVWRREGEMHGKKSISSKVRGQMGMYYVGARLREDWEMYYIEPTCTSLLSIDRFKLHSNECVITIGHQTRIDYITNKELSELQQCVRRVDELLSSEYKHDIHHISQEKQEWGKYMDVRRVCLWCADRSAAQAFIEFIPSLGNRITRDVFYKSSIFTQLVRFDNLVSLKIGFMNHSIREIEEYITLMTARISGPRIIPSQVLMFRKELNNVQMLRKKWVLRFKTIEYKRSFELYLKRLLKSKGFVSLKRTQQQECYFRVIGAQEGDKVIYYKTVSNDLQLYHELSMRMSASNTKVIQYFERQFRLDQTSIIHLIDDYSTIYEILLESKGQSEGICVLKTKSRHGHWFMPLPKEQLMTAEIDEIEGHCSIEVQGEKCVFFLFEHRQPVYLMKKDKNIYYKVISLFKGTANSEEEEDIELSEVLNKIKEEIIRQETILMYNAFFDTGLYGGRHPLVKTTYHIDRSSVLKEGGDRGGAIKRQFHTLYDEIMHHYFDKRQQYYFQRRVAQHIQYAQHMHHTQHTLHNEVTFSQIVLKCISSEDESVLSYEYYNGLTRNVADQEQYSQKAVSMMDDIKALLQQLVVEYTHDVIRQSMTTKEELQQSFKQFILSNPYTVQQLKLSQLIELVSDQGIEKYIGQKEMQMRLSLKKISDKCYTVIEEEEESRLHMPHSYFVTIHEGTVQLVTHKYVFRKQNELQKLRTYFANLTQYINISILFKRLLYSSQLPYGEYELYVCESVASNRVESEMRKREKKAPKRLQKTLAYRMEKETERKTKRFRLPLVFQGKILLHERMSAKEALNALSCYQIFELNALSNVRNACIFKSLTSSEQYFLLYFEEESKKCIVYNAFGVNTYTTQLQQEIRPLINQAIDERLFYIVSSHLNDFPGVLQPMDMQFIKGEQCVYNIAAPYVSERAAFGLYLTHNLQHYHSRTQIYKAEGKRCNDALESSGVRRKECLLREEDEVYWLYNWLRIPVLRDQFGKCLYILKVHCSAHEGGQMTVEDEYENINEYLTKRSSSKSSRTTQHTIAYTFTIIDSVGTPHFPPIKEAFCDILSTAYADYYFEHCIRSKSKLEERSVHDEDGKRQLSKQVLSEADELDDFINGVQGCTFYSVRCQSEMYIKSLSLYFTQWLEMVVKKLREMVKGRLPIVIYYEGESSECFLMNTFEEVAEKFWQDRNISKVGCIFMDQLERLKESADAFQSIRLGKQENNVHKSIYFHCQFTYKSLNYYSYNLVPVLNVLNRDHLLLLESWLSEKVRMLQFIRNVKEFDKYQPVYINKIIEVNGKILNKNDQEGNKNTQLKESDKNKWVKPSYSKLLLNLIFEDFPQKLQNGTFRKYQKDWNEIYKYLIQNPVNYKGRPEFKRIGISQLQRLGRQYLTFLRQLGIRSKKS